MWWHVVRGLITAVVVVTVAELSERYPRVGALSLTLPIVSITAWTQHRDMAAISRLAKEMLVLVPLGLPLFVPLALADRIGHGFWTAFALGIALASSVTTLWFWFGPKTL